MAARGRARTDVRRLERAKEIELHWRRQRGVGARLFWALFAKQL